jgi:hypothetical protein
MLRSYLRSTSRSQICLQQSVPWISTPQSTQERRLFWSPSVSGTAEVPRCIWVSQVRRQNVINGGRFEVLVAVTMKFAVFRMWCRVVCTDISEDSAFDKRQQVPSLAHPARRTFVVLPHIVVYNCCQFFEEPKRQQLSHWCTLSIFNNLTVAMVSVCVGRIRIVAKPAC